MSKRRAAVDKAQCVACGVRENAWALWKIKLAIDEEKADELKIGKVNVDEQMELAMRFQVSSIPMVVLLFKDGKPVAKSVGFCSKAELDAMVEKARWFMMAEAKEGNSDILIYCPDMLFDN